MFNDPLLFAEKVLKGTEELNGTQITAMTLIGLTVVFSALLILVIYLYCSGSAFRAGSRKSSAQPKTPVKTEVKAPAPAKAAPAAASAAPAEDDTEVIAVIMAAIAAMSEADGKQYRVRSVKPVQRSDARSIWANAGRADATRPF